MEICAARSGTPAARPRFAALPGRRYIPPPMTDAEAGRRTTLPPPPPSTPSPTRRGLLASMLAAAALLAGRRPARGQPLARFVRAPLSIHSASGVHRFSVEVARTPRQQAQGLMFRRRLDPGTGMLFVHRREAMRSMWMKNTFVPLDMLFIDRAGRIVHVVERAPPLSTASIPSRRPAAAVLELNAGTAQRLGVRPGDRVTSPALGG